MTKSSDLQPAGREMTVSSFEEGRLPTATETPPQWAAASPNSELNGHLGSWANTAEAPAARKVRPGKVFTVASASGGCGKTFFSTNFAFYLAGATGGKVLLVDLDLQFGEVATSLQLKPELNIADLANREDLSAALAASVMGHRANLDVLCAPSDPIAAEIVGPAMTTEVLRAAREMYDYIVVDTPPSLNEVVLSAFDQSASLVVMAIADVPSLRNMRVFLNTLQRLHLPAEQVNIVINKAEKGTGVQIDDARQIFPQGFSAVLPYAKEVSRSMNSGVPVVESAASSVIAQRLLEAATRLAPPAPGIAPAPPAARPLRADPWWRRLFAWFQVA